MFSLYMFLLISMNILISKHIIAYFNLLRNQCSKIFFWRHFTGWNLYCLILYVLDRRPYSGKYAFVCIFLIFSFASLHWAFPFCTCLSGFFCFPGPRPQDFLIFFFLFFNVSQARRIWAFWRKCSFQTISCYHFKIQPYLFSLPLLM